MTLAPSSRAGRPALCTVIAAALLALAGCGGSDTEEYGSQITDVMGPLSEETERLSTELTRAGSRQEALGLLEEAARTLDQGVDDLEAIEPPEGYPDLHERLVELQAGFAEATEDFRAAVERGEAQTAVGEYQQRAIDFRDQLEELRSDYADEGLEFQ